jgi:Integron Cassette Protein Hfx_Cass5
MAKDVIAEVGIGSHGGLFVRPATRTFPLVYREAMEVGWNRESGVLFGPAPREWDHARWFEQIVAAAREQNVELRLAPTTIWTRVPQATRDRIEAWDRREA